MNFCPRCGGDLRGLGSGTDTLTGPVLGKLIDGRYRVLERLGEGGMGSVFKVEHVRMGKVMALKLLSRQLARDKRFVARFEQEARIVSRLSHPNTVSVFDFGEVEELGLYMTMEYVPGRDLATALKVERFLPEPRAVGIAIQTLHSLGEAHEKGIVHRDVKPANLMLLTTRQGGDFVKVLDFGIAKLLASENGERRKKAVTGLADFVGTPYYVSPEQARGEQMDARSDLYSLGALLFELTVGRPPFEAPTAMGVLAKHLEEEAPRAAGAAPERALSTRFDELLAKALSKRPAQRFRSADDMRASLEDLAATYCGAVRLPSHTLSVDLGADAAIARRTDWDAFERSLRRSRITKAISLLLLLAAIGGAAVLAMSRLAREAESVVRSPLREEREPNDTLIAANLVRDDDEVRGTIGKRLSEESSDLDTYEFAVDGTPGSTRTARIVATGVPNVNLAMELFALDEPRPGDRRFRQIAKLDDFPLGKGPEVMDDLRLAPGRYVVRLRDLRRAGEGPGAPRENLSDAYAFTVTLTEPDSLGEVEPNNTPEDLLGRLRQDPSKPVLGHAGLRGERDVSGPVVSTLWSDDYFDFSLPGGTRRACVVLAGVRGATLRLSLTRADGALLPPSALRSVTVGEGGAEGICVAASTAVLARVDIATGSQGHERYALAVVHDGDGGEAAVLAARRELVANHRSAAALALTRLAVDLVPAIRPRIAEP